MLISILTLFFACEADEDPKTSTGASEETVQVTDENISTTTQKGAVENNDSSTKETTGNQSSTITTTSNSDQGSENKSTDETSD